MNESITFSKQELDVLIFAIKLTSDASENDGAGTFEENLIDTLDNQFANFISTLNEAEKAKFYAKVSSSLIC